MAISSATATVVVDLRTSYFRTELVNLVFIPPNPFDQLLPHHYRRVPYQGVHRLPLRRTGAEARACELAASLDRAEAASMAKRERRPEASRAARPRPSSPGGAAGAVLWPSPKPPAR
jgi:hypothetical protein